MQSHLTPGAQLRSIYLPSLSSRKDQTYLDYIKLLQQNGLWINPKLFPSYFQLKNGLQYPGVAASQQINQNEVMIRVPKRLVLNTLIALQRQELKQIFEEEFYHEENWEDRVLNLYLLYIYGQQQKQNIWYHMVKHFSKDIDILGFWPEEDLQKFKDLTVKSAGDHDRESFDHQWSQFQQVQQKYSLLQNPIFSKDNYKWIFIHITSRCFGKSLQFTSMAPFCEFVNHHCCNAYYDLQILKQQQAKEKQQESQNKKAEQDDNKSDLTSQGSYQSQDYIQIGEFAYDQIESVPLRWTCKQSFDLDQKQKKIILTGKARILNLIQNQLKWDDYTILFVPYLVQMCNLIGNEYLAGRKLFDKAYNDIKIVEECINYYREKIAQVYKLWRHKDYELMVHPKKQVLTEAQKKIDKKIEFPLNQKKTYQSFILRTGKKDKYLQNNQVYFCYGRNSNRTLLLRYGFCLQGNKYEHVWLSFEIVDFLKQFPDTLNKLEEKGLSLRRKFKIKYGRLNMDLIMFFRLNSWSFYGKKSVEGLFQVNEYFKEIAILNQIKDSLEFKLEQFQGQYDLTDKNLSYHDYFIAVYHREKQKIIIQHISFMNQLIEFNNKLQNGESLESLKSSFTPKQLFTYRHYLTQIQ